MTLENRYTMSQPEKIHSNMFAIFCIAASFLPDIVYFGKKKNVIGEMIKPCQHVEIGSVQWYEVCPKSVELFLSKTLLISMLIIKIQQSNVN